MATSVTSTGITFPDSTVQTTAASGGDPSWVPLGWYGVANTSSAVVQIGGNNQQGGLLSDLGDWHGFKITIACTNATAVNYFPVIRVFGINSSGTTDRFDSVATSWLWTGNGGYADGAISSSTSGDIYLVPNSSSFSFGTAGGMCCEVTLLNADLDFSSQVSWHMLVNNAYTTRYGVVSRYSATGRINRPVSTSGYYPAYFQVAFTGGIVSFNNLAVKLYGMKRVG
jgi:hypothetical protein